MRGRLGRGLERGQLRGALLIALFALSCGLVVVVALQGFSTIGAVRTTEQIALGVLISACITALLALIAVKLAGWRNPESEREFETVVLRSEALAREGLAAEPEEAELLALDPLIDEDFAEIVREALDGLPDLLRNSLRHVAVLISDRGARYRAYGLYQGGTVARNDTHDRIVIFRDTLRRDFGHDPELLRDQITRTVRHELAHHVGFDELGVSMLDL
jgi:predicted Zn-dependent protease with MMP-like domain